MTKYKTYENRLLVVDEKTQAVIHSQTVRIEGENHKLELICTRPEEGEIRIPISAILSDGTIEVDSFEASERLVLVTDGAAL
jgi:hypothetical protein